MKISRERLKQIIKEELQSALRGEPSMADDTSNLYYMVKKHRKVWLPQWTDQNIKEDLGNAVSDLIMYAVTHWKVVAKRKMLAPEDLEKIRGAVSELDAAEQRASTGLRTAGKDIVEYVPVNKSAGALAETGLGRRLGLGQKGGGYGPSVPDDDDDL